MSYLDVPRLHFAGTFVAKPSTVNNNPRNFDPQVTNPSPAWNPDGNHFWQFLNCRVKTAVGRDGKTFPSGGSDPVIGAAVQSTDTPTPAKLVDLDTEQQMVSQIWGLQIKVAASATDFFVGNFRVVNFSDIFFRVVGGGTDSIFSAYYQSVLDDVTWGKQLASPVLQELCRLSPKTLSIKFVVDGYDDDSASPTFNQGRIVGTIGPAFDGEPPNFVAGRFLRPTNFNPRAPFSGTPLYYGPARVDRKRNRVLVDLGNSIPTASSGGGPPSNLGTLQVAVMTSPQPTVLGEYDYSLAAYEATAGVQEFAATPEQIKTLATTPLGVLQVGDGGGAAEPVLMENANGAYTNVTQRVYRMSPGDALTVEVVALKFGEPAAGQTIDIDFNNNMLQPAPGIPVGVPRSALQFPLSAKTDAQGRARFKLKAGDPGNPRRFIGGQVYGVGFSWAAEAPAPPFPLFPDPNNFVSVLVFDAHPVPARPTWKDVQPTLAQYAKLYPFMRGIIDLSDYNQVVQNLQSIKGVLSLPKSDPRYMQVTRDMSPDKVRMILKWIDLGAPQ